MAKITILAVGKCRERFFEEAAKEYLKRLTPYVSVQVIEVKEAGRLPDRIPAEAYVIALAIEGKGTDSVSFAEHMQDLLRTGREIVFLIGDADGLGNEEKERADELLSMSGMTFPHQMARVILLEQLYRGFRISNGAPYHK